MISLKEFKNFKQKIPENIKEIREHYYQYLEYKKILMEELK